MTVCLDCLPGQVLAYAPGTTVRCEECGHTFQPGGPAPEPSPDMGVPE